MPDIAINPEECTTPEAWAELVRTERLSALMKHDELAAANATITAQTAQIEFLMRLVRVAPASEA